MFSMICRQVRFHKIWTYGTYTISDNSCLFSFTETQLPCGVTGSFPTNRSVRPFFTYWNEWNPLASLSLEAPCSVMELFCTNRSARFLLTHWNECNPLASRWKHYDVVSVSRCHLLYRLILAEIQCHSILIRCSKGREEKIDSLCHDIRDTEAWTFINNFAKRIFTDSRPLQTLINVNLSNFQMFQSAD
jgi:hypothetical protein